MGYNIISGISQQFYHTIPSEIETITSSPSREAVLQYLSQIGWDKFPEFILDILVLVEKHKPVDVTDGPGDEKQDILSINPENNRCLTQCKHSENIRTHYSGDELDRLVVACLRKNCQHAIFVTNTDLTVQAKTYVTDNEYLRGLPEGTNLKIEYWNASIIWEKIKNNSDILNKWFSGLGQVHGVRNFKFDITVQKMPFEDNPNQQVEVFEKAISLLISKDWVIEIQKELAYEINISEKFKVNIKRWFQFSSNLNINFILPNDGSNFFNSPLYAFAVEIIVSPAVGQFNPSEFRNEVIKKLGNELLENSDEHSWWHITSSQPRSFVYIHDIGEPVEIELATSSTFVKTNTHSTANEIEYCALNPETFELHDKDDNDDVIWLHKGTNIQVIQLFDQKIHPVEQYNHQLTQYHQLKKFQEYEFFAVNGVSSSMLMRVRRLLNHDWVAFQHNDDAIIWGIPPEEDSENVENVNKKLTAVGFRILQVKKEDVLKMLDEVKVDLVPSNWMIHSEIKRLSFPVSLDKRTFWLSKNIEVRKTLSEQQVLEILKYKYGFENQFGFDYMNGKGALKLNTLEIKNILFEIFSFRGTRMLDVSLTNPLSVNIRYREGLLNSSNDLAQLYLKEFENTYSEIEKIVNVN